MIMIDLVKFLISNCWYSGAGGSLPDDGVIIYGAYTNALDEDDNGPIVLPPSSKWTLCRTLSLSGYKVGGVRIWFSPGCNNLVEIRMHWNKSTWLPDMMSYSDHYSGDDVVYRIPVKKVISDNDQVDVFFRNLDYTAHTVDVKFDMIGDKQWKEKTPADILAQHGIGNLTDARLAEVTE